MGKSPGKSSDDGKAGESNGNGRAKRMLRFLYPDDEDYVYTQTTDRLDHAVASNRVPNSAVYQRCLNDLHERDEMAAAIAASLSTPDLCVANERASSKFPVVDFTASKEQIHEQREKESGALAREAWEIYESRILRRLDDCVTDVANLVMNLSHPEEGLASFMRRVQARMYAQCNMAVDIDGWGKPKKKQRVSK